MSIRPEIKPYSVITATSMGASINSAATIIQKLSMISYQFVWTVGSTPVGTVGVQVSNDFSLDAVGSISNAGTWSTYYFIKSDGTVVTSLSVSGSTGNAIIELPNVSFYAVRAIYTRTSGTGTLDALVCGKVT